MQNGSHKQRGEESPAPGKKAAGDSVHGEQESQEAASPATTEGVFGEKSCRRGGGQSRRAQADLTRETEPPRRRLRSRPEGKTAVSGKDSTSDLRADFRSGVEREPDQRYRGEPKRAKRGTLSGASGQNISASRWLRQE